MRVTAVTDGEEVENCDGAYDLYHQVMHPIDNVTLRCGDVLSLECTYENDTDAADAFKGGACLN